MLSGPWTDDVLRFMRDHHVEGLYLNSARGWVDQDYQFLRGLPWLRLLDLVTPAPSGTDLSPLESLLKLEKLRISTHAERHIDFSALNSLHSCFISWWPGASSILECHNLRHAYFDKMDRFGIANLAGLRDLQKLTLGNSPIRSIEPILELDKLERLELLNCRQIEDFQGIGRLRHLR